MTSQDARGSELEELSSAIPPRQVEALARIARRGDASPAEIEAIAACLGAPQKLVQRRAAETLAALARAGGGVRPYLIPRLGHEDWRSRWGAAYALALIGPPPAEALAVLLESLGSVDGDIRWAAADILLRMSDWENAPADLCDLLARGNGEQRKMAAYTLRALGLREPRVESALTVALSDPDTGARLAAVSALLHLATDRDAATDSASRLLRDADAGVRRATAALLGKLGTPRPAALEALRLAAASDDESLRRTAARSLRRLQGDG